MKMKTVAISSVIILIILIGLGYVAFGKYGSYYEVWESNWGITILEPDEIHVVFESKPSFHGDGEGYYVLEYNEKQMEAFKKEPFWQPINDASVHVLEGKVSSFIESVKEIYPTETEKYESIFQKNPVEYGTGDLYYYLRQDDGSYCITILNVEKKRMYMMEWTQ